MGLLRDRRRSVTELLRLGEGRPGRNQVRADELGLEQLPPRGALVQFSLPGSAPSRISLNRLAAAAAATGGEAVVVEHLVDGRNRLADRLGARTAPTVLHVAADGTVTQRWSRVPHRRELDAALSPPS